MGKKTYEQLLAENKQLLEEKEGAIAEKDRLVAEKDSKIKDLQTQVENFGKDAERVSELETEVEQQKAIIDAQTKMFEELKQDGTKDDKVFAVGKKEYRVLVPKFRVGAKIIKTSELGAYPEAFKELLKVEGQAIVELVK
jgi:hypothetical protein